MKSKLLLKWTWMAFCMACFVLFLVIAFSLAPDFWIQGSVAKTIFPKGSPVSLIDQKFAQTYKLQDLPIRAEIKSLFRLTIPKINVDVDLESVGLTPKGAVDVPKVFTKAAWFNLSPRPGEKGSSIIDGHFGFIKEVPGVFNNLHKLATGDKIFVEDGQGNTISFAVRKIKSFNFNAEALEVFSSTDELAHLNLITCEGVFDASSQNYSKRLVVFADKE